VSVVNADSWVLASNNLKKLTELRSLFSGFSPGFKLVAQGELNIAEVDEPHSTFIENALLKARHASEQSGLPALADDSGLCVPALGGEPGVRSARFADSGLLNKDPSQDLPKAHPARRIGDDSTDDVRPADLNDAGAFWVSPDREQQRRAQDLANNQQLLARLENTPHRSAYFVCTLVALRHAQDSEPLIAVGRWWGEILQNPRGAEGFGYDPLMFIPSLNRSVAELDTETKNRLSHRARAMQVMKNLLIEAFQEGLSSAVCL
jgi:XTP/dITP diphosphohydrolase